GALLRVDPSPTERPRKREVADRPLARVGAARGGGPGRPVAIGGVEVVIIEVRGLDHVQIAVEDAKAGFAHFALPEWSAMSCVTRAPYGGSASRISLSRRTARPAPHVGGRRSESLSEDFERSTLPPSAGSGSPAAPVIASAGRHVLFRISSCGSVLTGPPPGGNGKRS